MTGMRRFLRWMFNGLAALSLLLCVTTAMLWVQSYWAAEGLGLQTRQHFSPQPSNSPGDYVEYSVRSMASTKTRAG